MTDPKSNGIVSLFNGIICFISELSAMCLSFKIYGLQTMYLPGNHTKCIVGSQMDQRSVSPHVLILPSPLQGNVNSMLKLAELLCLAGIQVTFLNCHYPHHCLLSYSNVQARFSRYPGFRFETISDGLPMEHPRTAEQFLDIVDGVKTTTAPLFMEMMISWCRSTSDTRPPLTCIMADQLMSFATDVANEVGLPIVIFCAISACSFWAYFSFPQLIEAGEVPITGTLSGLDSIRNALHLGFCNFIYLFIYLLSLLLLLLFFWLQIGYQFLFIYYYYYFFWLQIGWIVTKFQVMIWIG